MSFALTPQAQILNGRVHTTDEPDSAYGIPVEDYGKQDFTIEFGFRVTSIKGACCALLAHWHTQKRSHEENHISIAVLPNRHVQVLVGNESVGTWVSAVSNSPIKFGVDYTLVLERVGSEACLYLNGALVSFFPLVGPTFFREHQLLSYHTGEVTGGSRAFWGLRVSSVAQYKGNVAPVRIFPEVGEAPVYDYDPYLFLQYTFADNEAINEVTETFASLSGAATVTDGKLVTTTSTDILRAPTLLLDAQAWTVEAKFRYSTSSANLGIIGVWVGNNTTSRWYLLWENATGALCLYFRNAAGQITITAPMAKPAANVDHHVEANYSDGTFRLFFNGVLVKTQDGDGVNPAGNTPLTMIDGGNTYNGVRWYTRIYKGVALHTQSFTPPIELPTVGRPVYDPDTSNAIRLQMDLRRDNALNEANGMGVRMNGSAQVSGSAVAHTASAASHYTTPIEPFGAGDFTVELEFNLTALNATYGGLLAGQWHYGQQTDSNNCWYLHSQNTRMLSFGIAKSSTSGDYTGIVSTTAFALSVDNHVVVERIGRVLTMYLNGVQVAQGNVDTPIRRVTPAYVRSNSTANFYTLSGKIWNLRIADKAMYNGVVKKQPQFPALIPRSGYEPAVLDDIVVQCSLRNGNARNEKTGQNITTSGSGAATCFGISTTLAASSRYYIPTDKFGDANFTIELKLVMLGSTGASTRPFFGQYRGGTSDNSWIFYTLGSNIVFQALDQLGNIVSLDSAAAGKTWVAGVEYHVVVERVGAVVSMYIDGVLMQSGTLVGPLVDMSAYPYITNLYDTSPAKYCATTIRDIRIAKRALFNGTITKLPLLEIPNQKPSLVMNSIGSPALHGAMQNLHYFGVASSAGAFSHNLFRDERDPQNVKVVRLVALVNDRGYTVLAYKPSDKTPSSDMPKMTDTLKVGEATVKLSAATSASTQAGAIGLYWNGNLLGSNTPGQCVPFEFI